MTPTRFTRHAAAALATIGMLALTVPHQPAAHAARAAAFGGDYPLRLCSSTGCWSWSETLDVKTQSDGRTIHVTSMTAIPSHVWPVSSIQVTYQGCSPSQGAVLSCGFNVTVTVMAFGNTASVQGHGLRYNIYANGSGYNVSAW